MNDEEHVVKVINILPDDERSNLANDELCSDQIKVENEDTGEDDRELFKGRDTTCKEDVSARYRASGGDGTTTELHKSSSDTQNISKSGRKRRSWTVSDKLRAVERVENGESQAQVCRDLGVAESTLRGWLKEKDRVREFVLDQAEGGGLDRKHVPVTSNAKLSEQSRLPNDELPMTSDPSNSCNIPPDQLTFSSDVCTQQSDEMKDLSYENNTGVSNSEEETDVKVDHELLRYLLSRPLQDPGPTMSRSTGPSPGLQHTNVDKSACAAETCDPTFSRSNSLTTHTVENSFKCDASRPGSDGNTSRIRSGRKANKRKGLNAELDNVTDDKHSSSVNRQNMCAVCNKVFVRRSSLTVHERSHDAYTGVSDHGTVRKRKLLDIGGNKLHMCTICDEIFSSYYRLSLHRRTHFDRKPFACEICHKTFTVLASLRTHKLSHAGVRPYVCEVCDKAFRELGSLRRHRRTHTGYRPYICEVCSKSFCLLDSLKKHRQTHTGDRPYTCQVCLKTFTQLCSLRTHTRLHTGDRPYICAVCNSTFTQLGSLKNHMNIHTGDKPYICAVCDKTFPRFGLLKSHMRIHLSDEEAPV